MPKQTTAQEIMTRLDKKEIDIKDSYHISVEKGTPIQNGVDDSFLFEFPDGSGIEITGAYEEVFIY